MNGNEYGKHFSKGAFWSVIQKFKSKLPFLRDVIAMYYCFLDDESPIWVKGLIIGALGYFISPVDASPDLIPIIGWLDDAVVINGALASVYIHIKPEHWRLADELLKRFDDSCFAA